MYAKRIATGAALAAAASIAAAGIAYAGPTPTANYQMCGYVYSNSAETSVRDMHNSNTALRADPAPANGATMHSGVTVEGKLNGLGTTYSATTDANGGFCMQGNATMAAAVTFGDTVSITKVNGGTAFATFHPSINVTTFNDHMTSSGLSATGLHIKI